MKTSILLLPLVLFFLLGCNPSSKGKEVRTEDPQGNSLIPPNAFVPTCENPDIVGSGKSTQKQVDTTFSHGGLLGKSGCVPKSKLVLDSQNNFCEFSVNIGGNTFFYIPYQTVYVHLRNGTTKSYSPGYYRSNQTKESDWNDVLDTCGPFRDDKDGVGICSLSSGDLQDDGNDRWFFTDKALIFHGVVCPSGIDCLSH